MSASGPGDVWAVGNAANAGIVLHWDGQMWSRVEVGDPGTHYWHLSGVDAVSPTDVWVVGGTATGRSGAPLVEHWDGNAWRIVPSEEVAVSPPSGLPYSGFSDIVARKGGTVVAVGESDTVAGNGASATLIEAGDEDGLHALTSPDPRIGGHIPFDHLFSVASAGRFSWAVGSAGDSPGTGGRGEHALALTSGGGHWEESQLPHLGLLSRLSGVAATSAGGAFAVGSSGVEGAPSRTLLMAWEGGGWKIVKGGTGLDGWLSAVGSSSDATVIAVGQPPSNVTGSHAGISLICT